MTERCVSVEEDSQQVHRKGGLSQGQDDKVPPPKKILKPGAVGRDMALKEYRL